MAATLILPKNEGDAGMTVTIQSLFGEAGLFDKTLQDTSSFEFGEVDLSLPSFKVDAGAICLNDTFYKMGMKKPFSSDAEFGRMTAGTMIIENVFHKAVISVDEEGTVAACVTVCHPYPPLPHTHIHSKIPCLDVYTIY